MWLYLSMISEAASSSSSSVGARFSSLGLCKNSSPPGQWTLVDEYNIEKKDPYQASKTMNK